MSMHEIESLVEDSIRILEKTTKSIPEKRNLIYNLYNFQARYDTGYTHFRLAEILKKNQFLFSIKINEYPEYQKHKIYFQNIEKEIRQDKSTWVSPPDNDTVYGVLEDEEVLLYFDYGSMLWQTLVKEEKLKDKNTPPADYTIPKLAEEIMKIAETKDLPQLIHQWYALLVNSFIEYEWTFSEKPTTFLDLVHDKVFLNIKEIGINAGVSTSKEDWGYLKMPRLKEELDLVNEAEMDRAFILRFWLNFSTEPAALIKKYNKEKEQYKKAQAARPVKYALLPKTFNAVLIEDFEWTYHGQIKVKDHDAWLWSKQVNTQTTDNFMRVFLLVEFWEDESSLHPVLGVQHGLLLRWQNLPSQHQPQYWHHHEFLTRLIPPQLLEENKNLNWLCGWKFRLSNTDKTIQKRLLDLLDNFKVYANQYFDKINKTYSSKSGNGGSFFNDYGKEKSFLIRSQGKAFGFKPKGNQFLYAPYISLAYAFYAMDKGESEMTKRYLQTAKENLETMHPESDLRPYLEPIIDDLLAGKKQYFPLVIHSYFRGEEEVLP